MQTPRMMRPRDIVELEKLQGPLHQNKNSTDILQNVQGNIFRHHGRNYATYMFFEFDRTTPLQELRNTLKELALHSKFNVTSGEEQRKAARAFDPNKESTHHTKFITLAFTSEGYNVLFPTASSEQIPPDPSFQKGLHDDFSTRTLSLSPLDNWQEEVNEGEKGSWRTHGDKIHMVMLLANASKDLLESFKSDLLTYLAGKAIHFLFSEAGELSQKNTYAKDGKTRLGYEPFGFRDNISEPPFWHNKKTLRAAYRKLVLDSKMGSYMVFLKLKQDVDAFNTIVQKITDDLFSLSSGFNQKADFKAFIEAQIMGRYKDGSPIHNQADSSELAAFNRFHHNDYNTGEANFSNPKFGMCPLHSHIRKVNPRELKKMSSPPAGYNQDNPDLKVDIRIARRGIPYAKYAPIQEPSQNEAIEKFKKIEEGLLFSSFQASINAQFETILKKWTHSRMFPGSGIVDGKLQIPGIDPIIGRQGSRTSETKYQWYVDRGGANTVEYAVNFQQIVTLKGGGYFYTPPIDWFNSL